MKQHRIISTLLLLLVAGPLAMVCLCNVGFAQNNVGIGTTTPNASALLELSSTSKGLLIPRMTQAQRNAIASPATGLLVYCTDSLSSSAPATFYYYTGVIWTPFLGGGWLVTGNSGTTAGSNFLGT